MIVYYVICGLTGFTVSPTSSSLQVFYVHGTHTLQICGSYFSLVLLFSLLFLLFVSLLLFRGTFFKVISPFFTGLVLHYGDLTDSSCLVKLVSEVSNLFLSLPLSLPPSLSLSLSLSLSFLIFVSFSSLILLY